jgi:hypothetical protein
MDGDASPSEKEFVMAARGGRSVEISEAAMQFFVEAMRANTDTLKQVTEALVNVQAEQRQQLNMVTDVRERIIRIESAPKFDKDLSVLKTRVELLERERAMEDGKAATWSWLAKNVPSIATLIYSIVAGIFMYLAVTGRLVPDPAVHQAIIEDPSAPPPTDRR